MPTSKTSHYDVIIVGAGINGCASAWFLRRSGLRVALIDQSGIAAGGSGAAGAFISPKFSKSGPLKEIMAAAHAEALDFYADHFSHYTLQRPLLHIANSLAESEKLAAYKNATDLEYSEIPETLRSLILAEAQINESIYLSRGAVVDAQGVCRAMANGVDFFCIAATDPSYVQGLWHVGNLCAEHLVLTTGAYPKVLPSESVKLRAIWGHRIDIRSTTYLPCILHHFVSISPTTTEGIIAVGATHDVHYDPFGTVPYDVEEGRKILLEKASKTLRLENVEVVCDYTGLRSGTHDYYPIAGALIDEDSTLKEFQKTGIIPDLRRCIRYPNAWMINGSGGYGFVLAPYLARRLAEQIAQGKALDPALSPGRFLIRQMKRQS